MNRQVFVCCVCITFCPCITNAALLCKCEIIKLHLLDIMLCHTTGNMHRIFENYSCIVQNNRHVHCAGYLGYSGSLFDFCLASSVMWHYLFSCEVIFFWYCNRKWCIWMGVLILLSSIQYNGREMTIKARVNSAQWWDTTSANRKAAMALK